LACINFYVIFAKLCWLVHSVHVHSLALEKAYIDKIFCLSSWTRICECSASGTVHVYNG